MRKLLIALALLLASCAITSPAYATGSSGKTGSAPTAPPPPPPPPTPQAPQDPNTANAVAREKTRRAQGGGNQSTLLTGSDGAPIGPNDLNKPLLGGNTLLGG